MVDSLNAFFPMWSLPCPHPAAASNQTVVLFPPHGSSFSCNALFFSPQEYETNYFVKDSSNEGTESESVVCRDR